MPTKDWMRFALLISTTIWLSIFSFIFFSFFCRELYVYGFRALATCECFQFRSTKVPQNKSVLRAAGEYQPTNSSTKPNLLKLTSPALFSKRIRLVRSSCMKSVCVLWQFKKGFIPRKSEIICTMRECVVFCSVTELYLTRKLFYRVILSVQNIINNTCS